MIKLTSSKQGLTHSNALRLFLFTGVAFLLGSQHLSAVDVRCPAPEKVKCGSEGYMNCTATTHLKKSKNPEMSIHWQGHSNTLGHQAKKLEMAGHGPSGLACLYDKSGTVFFEVVLSMSPASEQKFTNCDVAPQGKGFKCDL